MKLIVKTRKGTKTYDVDKGLVEQVQSGLNSLDGPGGAESKWYDNAARIIATFYGPTPETEAGAQEYVDRIAQRAKGDLIAWNGIADLLRLAHPAASRLTQLEALMMSVTTPDIERQEHKAEHRKLTTRVRAVAGITRGRIHKYYMQDFAPVRPSKPTGVGPPTVRDMVRAVSFRFERIAQHPSKHSREDASLAFMVVTLLHTALGEPTPPPSEELASTIFRRREAPLPEQALVTT